MVHVYIYIYFLFDIYSQNTADNDMIEDADFALALQVIINSLAGYTIHS